MDIGRDGRAWRHGRHKIYKVADPVDPTNSLRQPCKFAVADTGRRESDDADPDDVTGRFRLTCGRLALRPWSMAPPVPENGAATVQFQAGYGAPEAVPDDLKLAVKLLVAGSYSARNGCPEGSPLPSSVASILDTHRRVRL